MPQRNASLHAWHQPVTPYIAIQDGQLTIILWLQSHHYPQQVFLRCEPDNEEWLLAMSAQTCHQYRCYQVALPLIEGQPTRRYCFKLLWATEQQWFSPLGFSPIPPPQLAQFAVDTPDNGPEWVADQIFYQIFPDRFASSGHQHAIQSASDDDHTATSSVRRLTWDQPLDDTLGASTFYGGDLDGISEKLPYLTALGVTALYLNPIFTSPSVHKYDTEDYYQVDPHFGGNAAFIRLREKTQQRHIRLVLDGVFNHTGETHHWFDRLQKSNTGACYHQDSPYRSYFNFLPDGQVLCWKGHAHLPKLNFATPQVVEEIYRGEKSVVRHWLQAPYLIDGWRLDVVHMLGEEGGAKRNLLHLDGIYQAAKQENPQAYILGEHFGDARNWLHAGVEDAAMNYMGFALPVRSFLAGIDVAYQPITLDATSCIRWMETYRAGLSHQQQLRLFNQLDSHDTARFLTMLHHNRQRMVMAVVWLFSWIGVPCIYYGDEIGLDGGNDPMCRKPFPWDQQQWDHDLLALYRRMITLRRESYALRHGACEIHYAKDETVIFMRFHGKEQVLVALQRQGDATINLPLTPLLDTQPRQRVEGEGTLTHDPHHLTLHLPPESVTVWRSHRKK